MKKSLQELADETKDCPQCKAKLKLLVDYDSEVERLTKYINILEITAERLKFENDDYVGLFFDSEEKLEKLYRIAIGYQNNLEGFAGQALTEYKCIRCDEDRMHSNTMVPVVCPTCVREIEKNFSWDKI